MTSSVCIDASVVIRALVPGPLTNNALELLAQWRRDRAMLIAPALLAFEVTATLRRMVYLQALDPDEGEEAFQQFRQFDIRLSHRAEIFVLAWTLAKRFNRPRAYDTTYLALAQLNNCDCWTADERLVNAVCDQLPWVKWIGNG